MMSDERELLRSARATLIVELQGQNRMIESQPDNGYLYGRQAGTLFAIALLNARLGLDPHDVS